jgi:hypothetical protein
MVKSNLDEVQRQIENLRHAATQFTEAFKDFKQTCESFSAADIKANPEFYRKQATSLNSQYNGLLMAIDMLLPQVKGLKLKDDKMQSLIVEVNQLKQLISNTSEVAKLEGKQGQTKAFLIKILEQTKSAKKEDISLSKSGATMWGEKARATSDPSKPAQKADETFAPKRKTQ